MITVPDYAELLHGPADGLIWHYTSASAFLEIVRTQSLWLSHHAFMNDPAEGRVGYTQFCNATWIVEEESTSDNIQIAMRRARKRWDPNEEAPIPSLLTSFSLHGDSLSQWARYADQGRGVALGFEIGSDCRGAFGGAPGPEAIRVRYCRKLGEEDEPDPLVVALARKATTGDVDAELDALFALIEPAFKEAGYEEESEVRLVVPTMELSYLPDLSYRATSRGIVPYVKLPIDAKTVKLRHVRFGPSHPDDTFLAIDEFFRRYVPDVDFTNSELAYRP